MCFALSVVCCGVLAVKGMLAQQIAPSAKECPLAREFEAYVLLLGVCMTNQKHLWGKVFELCANKNTGCFVFEGEQGKSGQVVVANGCLLCVMYGGVLGQQAINVLNADPPVVVSESAARMFPAAAALAEPQGQALLDQLGFDDYLKGNFDLQDALASADEPSVAELQSEPEEYIEVTYRGQKLRKLKETSTSTEPTKKSKRIYRGHVVHD